MTKVLHNVGGVLTLCSALFCIPAWAVPPDDAWSLRVPEQEKLLYRGLVSFDKSGGGPGAVLYPAPSVGGFLAAVITHGLITSSQQNAQKDQMQRTADLVLKPYQPVLDQFTPRDLLGRALDKVRWGASRQLIEMGAAAAGWTLDVSVVFLMTQDHRALIVESLVSAIRPGESGKPASQTTVRVVSRPRVEASPEEAWKIDNGAVLKEESARLLAHSLELALEHLYRPSESASSPRTVRYPEGSAEQMERAKVVRQYCDRAVLLTLRGNLLSVPFETVQSSDSGRSCSPALPDWR